MQGNKSQINQSQCKVARRFKKHVIRAKCAAPYAKARCTFFETNPRAELKRSQPNTQALSTVNFKRVALLRYRDSRGIQRGFRVRTEWNEAMVQCIQ